MTQQQINTNLLLVAAEKRVHPYYKYTVEIAEKYTALSTGVGISALMRMYSRREDAELFRTRCEITQQVTSSIITKLFEHREKAFRSHYRRELTYGIDEASTKKTTEFEGLIAGYAGKMGIDDYCQERLIELNQTDPNTWIVNEWKDFDNRVEYAQPYPLEVSSAAAVDFAHTMGDLDYLTALSYLPNPKDASRPLKRLTCYQKFFTSTLTQTGSQGMGANSDPDALIDGQTVNIEGWEWVYQEYRHDLPYVQAKRVGYRRDKITGGQTYVWPIEAAEPYLMKTLKVVSELDLTAANVAFPVSIRYGDICHAPGCSHGYVGEHVCTACKGTGQKQSPTSVLEEIVVTPMPTDAANMLDLSKLLVHVSPDVSILQWQQQYADELERKCMAADLKSELFSRKEIAETATGKSIDQQNANDVVYKFFRFYADFWQFLVYSYADIIDKRDGLTAQIVVNRDLKLKTVNELFADLKEATDSGAGAAARQSIEWDIMRAITIDSPEEFIEWQVKEKFNPFSGFTDEQKMVWSQSPLIPIEQRVLFMNLGYIFEQIESENSGFYRMPYDAQKIIVDKKVQEIVAMLNVSGPDIGA